MAKPQFNLDTELTEHNIWPFTSGRAVPAVPVSLWAEKDFFLIYSLFKNYKVHFHCLVRISWGFQCKNCSQGEVLLTGSCVWMSSSLDMNSTARIVVRGSSSGGWSKTSPEGWWRTGEEPSLPRTSLIVDVNCVPMEQAGPHHCLEGRQRNMDEVGPCC